MKTEAKNGIVADGYGRLFVAVKEQIREERKPKSREAREERDSVLDEKPGLNEEVLRRMKELGANDYTCW